MSKALKPLCVELYSLRDYAARDGFCSVLKRVADMGYVGVEPAGYYDVRPSELKKIVEDHGLKMFTTHSPMINAAHLGEGLELMESIGIKTACCGASVADFKTLDSIKRAAEATMKMKEKIEANGFTLIQHNHYWEFDRIDGRLKYEIYRELCPGLKFQLDCFWSTNSGKEDACKMFKLFAADTLSLHIKDGLWVPQMVNGKEEIKAELLPLGTGCLPIKELIAMAPDTVKDVIVELDFCHKVEMYEALQQSYDYMISNNLAFGNK